MKLNINTFVSLCSIPILIQKKKKTIIKDDYFK